MEVVPGLAKLQLYRCAADRHGAKSRQAAFLDRAIGLQALTRGTLGETPAAGRSVFQLRSPYPKR